MVAQLLAMTLLLGAATSFKSPSPCRYHHYQRMSSSRQLPENRRTSPTAYALSSRPKTSLRTAGIEEVWSSYLTALEADPLLVKSVTAGVILGAADLTGQAIQQAITIDTDNSSESGDESASNGVDFARFARFAFL